MGVCDLRSIFSLCRRWKHGGKERGLTHVPGLIIYSLNLYDFHNRDRNKSNSSTRGNSYRCPQHHRVIATCRVAPEWRTRPGEFHTLRHTVQSIYPVPSQAVQEKPPPTLIAPLVTCVRLPALDIVSLTRETRLFGPRQVCTCRTLLSQT